MRCTAKSKRSGNRCRNNAVTGRNVCRMHGGKSPIGPASATYRDGRHSRYLPTGLREKFKLALDDPELTSLRDEIALCDVRVGSLIERIKEGTSGRLWSKIREHARKALIAGASKGKAAELMQHVAELGRLVEDGCAEQSLWDDLFRVVARRKSLCDSERRRQVEQHFLISVARVQILIDALIGAVHEEHADDPAGFGRIADAFARLIGRTDILEVEATGVRRIDEADGAGADGAGVS